jgi:hypothetical protein
MAQLPLTCGLGKVATQDIFCGIAKYEFFTSGFSQLQVFEESGVGKFAHGSQ